MVSFFSPLRDSSGLLAPSVSSCPSPLSFLPICLLSACFCLFSRPPPVSIPQIVRPPSFVRRKATKAPTSADQCLPLVSFPSVPYAGLHPPRPVRLVVLGLGVGGWPKETAPPVMVVSPSTRLVGVARESVLSSTLEFSLESCGARLSVCPPHPPPPFPVKPYVSLYSPS